MTDILPTLTDRFSQALTTAFGQKLNGTDPLVVPASNPKFGDYQSNVALSLAKPLKKSPRDIAQAIIDAVQLDDMAEIPTIAGPGFINIKLKTDYLQQQLNLIKTDSRIGASLAKEPERIVVDFSSPNIAKEMHVGHLRSTIIGDCIARTLAFQGHEVIRLNHVGDWGTQFGMLIAYLRETYPEALTTADALDIGDLVEFYRKAKVRFDEDETFKETARNEVVKLQAGNSESRHAWQLLCDQSRREFQVIYDRLDIEITERGESFYNQFLTNIVDQLAFQRLLEEDAGAKCVFLEGFSNKAGDPLPLIVQKSDGGYNYATTDLAALQYRINEDGANKILYVTDLGQANHFSQVFQVAQRAGLLPSTVKLIHVPFGLVKGEDGKKLKTRSGDTIKLRDLLDEAVERASNDLNQRLVEEERQESAEFQKNVAQTVGIAAVKYADLSQNRTSDYIFSFDKMLSLQGNTAPYLLYAYARIKSIEREAKIDFSNLSQNTSVGLQETSEVELAKMILQLDQVIQEVEKTLLPNRLCDYLYELCKKYNQFYENCPVLKSEEPVKSSRLLLCNLCARTLKLGLSLLGIPVLPRM